MLVWFGCEHVQPFKHWDIETIVQTWPQTASNAVSHLFFKFYIPPLQGIFLVYDITSERSFQHIMKWASDVDEVSHTQIRDLRATDVIFCLVKRQNWQNYLQCSSHRLTKNRCLTWCDTNQMLFPDKHCSVYYISSYLNTCHKYWNIFFYTHCYNFLSASSLRKAISSALLPLSFPRWFYSINVVIMDLISRTGLSEYSLYWSWHDSHLLLIKVSFPERCRSCVVYPLHCLSSYRFNFVCCFSSLSVKIHCFLCIHMTNPCSTPLTRSRRSS